mmetsp:Transcript_28135/g.64384  ORF Transcript_28135/g.64384 Transcript_28135/m.64384 type:complete len:203 (-) Transcript_28135:416-1024(-)
MFPSRQFGILIKVTCVLVFVTRSASFTFVSTPHERKCAKILRCQMAPLSNRRIFLSTISTAAVTTSLIPTIVSAAVDDSKESMVSDLKESLVRLQSVPDLLKAGEWEKARGVLKSPPVNQLWNLGESKNTLVKLAKQSGDFELLEMKDELAISLQMTDQYAYDNVFVYFQPGDGKMKTKEPLEMVNKAMVQLQDAIAIADPK